jgi:hypothetical protein
MALSRRWTGCERWTASACYSHEWSFSRDDILARVRARLALDPALVYARRREAFDSTDACAQNRRARLAAVLTQRFSQRSLAMSSRLDRVNSVAQVPGFGSYLTTKGLPLKGACWAYHARPHGVDEQGHSLSRPGWL